MLMPVIAVCLATQTLIRLACGMVIDGARRAAASSCWATRGGSTPLVPACTAVPVAASTESCFKAKPCHGHCFPNLLSGASSSHPTPARRPSHYYLIATLLASRSSAAPHFSRSTSHGASIQDAREELACDLYYVKQRSIV